MKTLQLITLFIIYNLSFNISYAQSPVDSVASGCALDFDGVSNYVKINDNISLHVTTHFSLECWAKIDTTKVGVLISKYSGCPDGSSPYKGNSFVLNSSKRGFSFSVNENGNYFNKVGNISITNVINDNNAWHHIAVTFSNGFVSLYVDGVLISSGNFTIDTNDPLASFTTLGSSAIWSKGNVQIFWSSYPTYNYTGILTVNAAYNGTEDIRIGSSWLYCGFNSIISVPYKNQIDEVRIWNKALTQTEIQQNMCKKLAGTEAGLVGYWRFDDCGSLTATDDSGNGNNGTLN